MAAVMVDRKPRVTCWAAATGTTISALISSTPTARMAIGHGHRGAPPQ